MSPPRTRDTVARNGPGEVAFVGTGPADPGLLTLRAVDRLAAADVVVTDQPGREALVATYCRPDVEVLDASFGENLIQAQSKDGLVVLERGTVLMEHCPATQLVGQSG